MVYIPSMLTLLQKSYCNFNVQDSDYGRYTPILIYEIGYVICATW